MKKMTLAKASQSQVSALARDVVDNLGRPSETPSEVRLAGVATVALALMGLAGAKSASI